MRTVDDAINYTLGPLSTLAGLSYLRMAYVKSRAGENAHHIIGAWICFLVVGGISAIRALGALHFIGFETVRDWTLPMGIPAYLVHVYMAYRLTEIVRERERLRTDAARARRVIKEIIRDEQERG